MAEPTTLPAISTRSYVVSKDTYLRFGKRHSNNTYATVAITVGTGGVTLNGTSMPLTGTRTQIIPAGSIIVDNTDPSLVTKWWKVTADVATNATSATIEAAKFTAAANDTLQYIAMWVVKPTEWKSFEAPPAEPQTVEVRDGAGNRVQLEDGVTFPLHSVILNLAETDWRIEQLMSWRKMSGTARDIDVIIADGGNGAPNGGKTMRAKFAWVDRIRGSEPDLPWRVTFSPLDDNPFRADGTYY
jgi:hypothetical protein